MSKFLFFIYLIPNILYAFNGNDQGNGGDQIAQEFTFLGQEIVKYLPDIIDSDLSEKNKNAIIAAVEKSKINVKDILILNDVEVDAINYPSKGIIEVSKSRWMSENRNNRNSRWGLALHEYLWMAGIDDTGYRVSNPLFLKIKAAKERKLKTPISTALRKALCTSIIVRDYNTIEETLKMGADLDGSCEEVINYSCESTSGSFYNRYNYNPLAIAIKQTGQISCKNNTEINPDLDIEMLKIIDLILQYHPDVKVTFQHTYWRENYFQIAIRKQAYRSYQLLLKYSGLPTQWALGYILEWGDFSKLPLWLIQDVVEAGGDVNTTFPKTQTVAAYLVSSKGRPDIIEYLTMQRKIDFCGKSILGKYPGDETLYRVIDFLLPEYFEIVKRYGGPCVPL